KSVTDDWRGKRVLVIGAGNSACDIAVEAARTSRKVCVSMRSPQWFVPKFIMGIPSDVFAMRFNWLPRKVKQFALTKLLRVIQGPYRLYGLPENTQAVLSHHPTLNSELLDFIRHGRIAPRPAVQRFSGRAVEFADGTREDFDIVCACTGFWITFPFFDRTLIDFRQSTKVPLFRMMLHPGFPSLYFMG